LLVVFTFRTHNGRFFRKRLCVFDIFHVCVVKSCVCQQLSLNEYMMVMMMSFELPTFGC